MQTFNTEYLVHYPTRDLRRRLGLLIKQGVTIFTHLNDLNTENIPCDLNPGNMQSRHAPWEPHTNFYSALANYKHRSFWSRHLQFLSISAMTDCTRLANVVLMQPCKFSTNTAYSDLRIKVCPSKLSFVLYGMSLHNCKQLVRLAMHM